jgi:hypothetical protein
METKLIHVTSLQAAERKFLQSIKDQNTSGHRQDINAEALQTGDFKNMVVDMS